MRWFNVHQIWRYVCKSKGMFSIQRLKYLQTPKCIVKWWTKMNSQRRETYINKIGILCLCDGLLSLLLCEKVFARAVSMDWFGISLFLSSQWFNPNFIVLILYRRFSLEVCRWKITLFSLEICTNYLKLNCWIEWNAQHTHTDTHIPW